MIIMPIFMDDKMKKVGIVGYGYVGKAISTFFGRNFKIVVYDPFLTKKEKLDAISHSTYDLAFVKSKDHINKCDLVLVCVPTPELKDGSCDISAIQETIEWLTCPLIVIKSTIEIGTIEKLERKTGKRIIFSPEFCGESSYWTPYKFHKEIVETPFFIFGGDPEVASKIIDFYMAVAGPTKEYRIVESKVAETIKYMENTFYALKVTFCYEIAEICKTIGITFNEVRNIWLLDPRVNPMHTAVFEENDFPYGGKCFPKDLAALVKFAEKSGYDSELLKEVQRSNKRIGELRKARRNSQK